jgi:hypothetical protein
VGACRLRPSPSRGRSRGGEPDWVAAHTAAFLCFAAPSRHCVEPLFPDAFTAGPPLAVGEHHAPPISCGARSSSRGRAASLERSPPCPCTPPRCRAYAGDVIHRARLGKTVSCRCRGLRRRARSPLSCSLSAREPSRELACRPCTHTRVRHRRAEPLGLSRARPGSTRTHSPCTAHACSRAAGPSLGSPELAAWISSLSIRERACAHSKYTSPAPVTPSRTAFLFPQA